MENPFKFGAIVEGNYFTDRVQEVAYIKQYIESPNHLILISPRRFGKSSLVQKALRESGRTYLSLNLQHAVSTQDLAANLLKDVLKEICNKEDFGKAEPSGKTFMIEFSSPNTNKPLHLDYSYYLYQSDNGINRCVFPTKCRCLRGLGGRDEPTG